MTRGHAAAIGLLVVMTCTVYVTPAASENLVKNGDFDVSLRHWGGNYGGWRWSPDDAAGGADSGSAELISSLGQSLDPYTFSGPCFPVVGGSSYRFSATRRLIYDTGVVVTGQIALDWSRGLRCGRPISLTSTTVLSIPHGDWSTRSLTATAPIDAGSASIFIYLLKTGGAYGTTLRANFDDIVVESLGPPPTSTTLPSCGGLCGDPVAGLAADALGESGNDITASDALYILAAAVGEASCSLCVCDVDGSGDVTATDGLLTLAAVTGVPVDFACPAQP